MTNVAFAYALASHILLDFYIQNDKMAQDKEQSAPVLVLHCALPHLFDVIDKFLLLTFGITLATKEDYHILCVTSCLLNGINRDGRISILAVARIPRTKCKI